MLILLANDSLRSRTDEKYCITFHSVQVLWWLVDASLATLKSRKWYYQFCLFLLMNEFHIGSTNKEKTYIINC